MAVLPDELAVPTWLIIGGLILAVWIVFWVIVGEINARRRRRQRRLP